MCTIKLEYNKGNALARRKLAALLATGLFSKVGEEVDEPTPEEIQAHRELRDGVLEHSRKNMSHVIARYVDEEVDKLWESGQWDDKKNEAILNEHLRTPYEYGCLSLK